MPPALCKDELPPFTVVRASVTSVDRISPSFARVTFSGEELRTIGNPDRTLDQRVKLIFPPASGDLPDLPTDSEEWYVDWLALPEDERGAMRTYSIRELRVATDGETHLMIDFVLHLAEGATGPASLWASLADVGDQLLMVAPRRGRFDGGGIEFEPGGAQNVVLVGDETAAPAIARILEELPRDARGTAFIEVPLAEDRLAIDAPAGVDVRWFARAGEPHGTRVIPEVLEFVGKRMLPPLVDDAGPETLVWETPQFSQLGESIDTSTRPHDRYFWIAGESSVVTTLRRHLVRDFGVERAQVSFMGYWRRGVAMRS